MNKPFPAWVDEYLTSNAGIKTTRELSEGLIAISGSERYNEQSVRNWAKRKHISLKVDGRKQSYGVNKILSAEQHELFVALSAGRSSEELRQKLELLGINLTVSQIRSYRKRHRLPSGRDTRFKTGHKNPPGWAERCGLLAKGVGTRFKSGHSPHNKLPIGTEIIKDDGYLWRKIAEPNRWRQVHRLVWEETHGKIGRDKVIVFLDGNKLNTDLSNLAEVSLAENAVLIRKHRRNNNPVITEAYVMLTHLESRINKKEEQLCSL